MLKAAAAEPSAQAGLGVADPPGAAATGVSSQQPFAFKTAKFQLIQVMGNQCRGLEAKRSSLHWRRQLWLLQSRTLCWRMRMAQASQQVGDDALSWQLCSMPGYTSSSSLTSLQLFEQN